MAAPPGAVEPPQAVNEADKPFILVLVLLAAVVGLIVWSTYKGSYDDIKDVVATLIGVLASGFMLYFKAKTS